MVTTSYLFHVFVVLIQKGMMTVTMPVQSVERAFPGKQYIFALPSRSLEVTGPLVDVPEAAPDEVTCVCENVWRFLHGVLVGELGRSRVRCYEEKSRAFGAKFGYGNIYMGWQKVGAAAESAGCLHAYR